MSWQTLTGVVVSETACFGDKVTADLQAPHYWSVTLRAMVQGMYALLKTELPYNYTIYSKCFVTPCAVNRSSFVAIRGIMNKMAEGDERLEYLESSEYEKTL